MSILYFSVFHILFKLAMYVDLTVIHKHVCLTRNRNTRKDKETPIPPPSIPPSRYINKCLRFSLNWFLNGIPGLERKIHSKNLNSERSVLHESNRKLLLPPHAPCTHKAPTNSLDKKGFLNIA